MKKNSNGLSKGKKTALVVGGILVGVATGIVVYYLNKNSVAEPIVELSLAKDMIDSPKVPNTVLEDVNSKVVPLVSGITREPHHVTGHLMKLAEGKCISEEKQLFAMEHNIEIPEGYTYRDGYETGIS